MNYPDLETGLVEIVLAFELELWQNGPRFDIPQYLDEVRGRLGDAAGFVLDDNRLP